MKKKKKVGRANVVRRNKLTHTELELERGKKKKKNIEHAHTVRVAG